MAVKKLEKLEKVKMFVLPVSVMPVHVQRKVIEDTKLTEGEAISAHVCEVNDPDYDYVDEWVVDNYPFLKDENMFLVHLDNLSEYRQLNAPD